MESIIKELPNLMKVIGPISLVVLFISWTLSIIYIFGLWKNMPKWLRVATGIFQILTVFIIAKIILTPCFCG